MKVISTDSLTKRYRKVVALSDVSISVNEGDIYGFLGPNGAGKTTTIRLILDLISPTSGRVEVFGHDVTEGLERFFPRIGSVLGDPAFYPHLTGRENLELFSGLLPSGDKLTVAEGLDLVELEEKADLRFGNFSAGMRRRLALALAYIKKPDLYVLDEPTSGLDPKGRVEVREMIKSLGEEGRTVFLSTHLLNEVQETCSRVGVLKDGRLIDESPVSDLLAESSGVKVIAEQGEMEQLKKVLNGLEYVRGIEVREGAALVDCPAERSSDVLRELAAEGVEVQEVEKSKRSLEDVFMDLTGGGKDD
ncbi:MAG: ATP-binding cassette domain-containing protein [Candidatus Bipolaricaulota bacterium]